MLRNWGMEVADGRMKQAEDWRAEMSEGAGRRKQVLLGWRAGKQAGRRAGEWWSRNTGETNNS